jgi:cardiolipin synthase (CMP-forming)
MITSLPNLLTLSRIGAIPAIVALFWVEGDAARWVMLGVYTLACVTDFLDGYFARSMKIHSNLGQFLDPVADKLLVGALIFMLVAFDRLSGLSILPGLIILCREILVSGLREFLAELRVGMPVSKLAKWKTAIQMFTLGFLIVGDASPDAIPSVLIGDIGIWMAAVLTLVTGYDYLRVGLTHIIDDKEETSDAEPAARVRKTGESV